MKIFVKTLKGSQFEIQVNPTDKIADVKKSIETIQGQSVYPAELQMLIHQGQILKDDTAVEDTKIAENSFVVVMLSKAKTSSTGTPVTAKASPSQVPNTSTTSPNPSISVPALSQAPAANQVSDLATSTTPAATTVAAPAGATAPAAPANVTVDAYGQAASALVAGTNLEGTIQQILDMGGGAWDRDTVIRALRAAFNNPERAVEYLYSGIPAHAEAPPVARSPASAQTANSPSRAAPAQLAQPAIPSSGPNANPTIPSSGPNINPLDLFPQGLPNVGGSNAGTGSLDFLRDSPQFRALQAMVQANPQILQPMLQELGKQNPQIMRLIQDHQSDFLRLINEPTEGGESNMLSQLASIAASQSVQVTPQEREAIERLEAMGFDRAHVLEVYFACNKNEELAANYLLDHMHELEE